MNALLLIVPGVSEVSAVPRSGYAANMQMSAEWNGTWQNARINHGDAAAWALVTFFLVTLGLVAGCVAAALTRPRGPTREHLLIDEVLRNEDQLANGNAEAAWEKPEDWWKGENS
jgi:hypothetical protein